MNGADHWKNAGFLSFIVRKVRIGFVQLSKKSKNFGSCATLQGGSAHHCNRSPNVNLTTQDNKVSVTVRLVCGKASCGNVLYIPGNGNSNSVRRGPKTLCMFRFSKEQSPDRGM